MNSMINMTLTPTKKATTFMMTYEQIQQMFNEDSDDDEPIQDCDLYTSIYGKHVYDTS